MDLDNQIAASLRNSFDVVHRSWYSLGIKIISPLYISMFNTLIAICAAFVPSSLYINVLGEPDFLLFNWRYFCVLITSEIAFCLGIWTYSAMKGRSKLYIYRSPRFHPTRRLLQKSAYLLYLVIILEIFLIGSIIVIVGYNKLAMALVDPNMANAVRLGLIASARIHGVNILAFQFGACAALLVAFFVILNVNQSRVRFRMLSIHIFASMLYILESSFTLSRWPIMAYLLSLVALVVLKRNSDNGTGIKRISIIFSSLLVVLIIFFVAFSFVRMGSSQVFSSIFGYTFGSYNLGAAAISKVFIQPYSGTSYGVLGMLWNAPLVGVDLRLIGDQILGLGLPTTSVIEMGKTVNMWTEAVARSGLNVTYLWDTIYGFVYSDVGFLYIFVFFIYGFVSWYLYDGLLRLSLLKMLLYIVFFISLVTWFTSAFISNTPLDDFTFFAVLISLYLRKEWRLSLMEHASE